MEKLKIVIKKYWKIYLAALVISAVCDLIGTVKLNIGVGTLTLFPMVFAVIFGGLLGPDIFKVFKTEECKIGGSLVLVVLAPFMAKMGISSGVNLAKLVSVGPALLLQEFGNLGTILLSMPWTGRSGNKRNLCSLYRRFCNRNSIYQHSCKRCSFLEYFRSYCSWYGQWSRKWIHDDCCSRNIRRNIPTAG